MHLANKNEIYQSFMSDDVVSEPTSAEFGVKDGYLTGSLPVQFGDILFMSKSQVVVEGDLYQNLIGQIQTCNPCLASPILAMAVSNSEFKVSKLCLQALQSRLAFEEKIEF